MHDRLGGGADDAERLLAHLVPVAVRAVEQVAAPALAHARDVGQHVAQAGGDQHASRTQDGAVSEADVEARLGVAVRRTPTTRAGDDVGAVPGHLLATQAQQLGGREAVAGEEALHVLRGAVAGLARVHDRDAALRAGQDQGC